MAEFEASRVVHAAPDTVFAVASDVERMAQWVPVAADVQQSGPDTLHLSGADSERDALWRAQPDQRRVEWGDRDTGDYAGWLQVYASGTDEASSEAVLHLSFLGDQPQAHAGQAGRDVESALATSLESLAGLAERTAAPPAGESA